ncbi:hypothetical protein KIW84_010322 [Lathyrus oleraceus]|uniref:Replication protein A 70 kDa DNA-binding subunit B/D first OB fold domain-containing protein n=1 Tax=Pisum sativum TaxID=3888 RepID=A0A9D4YKJ4_PEA|nr:hypothetical protein KIW84_010322 [Pisum sativum]
MARPIESVMDINDSKDLWKIVVRCRHLWTVRSSSNKEHLELILVDSKLDMIQAIVPSHLVSKYVGDLAVGASYIMQIHDVSKIPISLSSSQDDMKSLSEPLSVSADFDPNAANSVMTPCKRINPKASEDVESVQLSSTKMMKPVKKEDGR